MVIVSIDVADDEYVKYNIYIYSSACLIDEEGDSFLLTGGGGLFISSARTSRYSSDSWLEDLDDLNFAREEHACGWYTDTQGKRVRYI